MSARTLAPLTGGLMLLATAFVSQSQNAPIPGIGLVVRRRPAGGDVIIGQSGRDGLVRAPIRVETGEYEVRAVCLPRCAWPSFLLAWVRINGRQINPDARGRFVFPVRSPGEVRLEALVTAPAASTARR